jgi:tetratricopeptide (TPR) repeat protein
MSEQEPRKNPFEGFRIEIDPERIEQALKALRERVQQTVTTGRYTKVRLSYKGKPVMPDLPLGVFLATEGLAFWLVNPLAALLVNLGARAILDVEFLHEADELVREGLAAYLDGEITTAEERYREALSRRPDDPAALYNLGTLLRVTGRTDEAVTTLRRAAMGPEGHPDVARASEALERLTGGKRTL